MFPNDASRLFDQWLSMLPLGQAAITLTLSSFALLVIFMALGAYWGFQQGFRNLITVAIWTILGYILTVQGGTIVVDIINRFWQNGPRLFAFAIGQDVGAVPVLDPLIEPNFQIPLFFRFVAFIAAVLLGFFFNEDKRSTWRGEPKEPLAKPLGLFVGALVVLLWTNAAVVFWEEYQAGGGTFGGPAAPIAQVLNTLPNVSVFMPSLIAIFFLIVIVLILVNFPNVWKGSSGGGGGKK